MVTMLDRCPAWTTDNLTALGNDVGHVRTQLDWLLEDLGDVPDARVGYLESQLAECTSIWHGSTMSLTNCAWSSTSKPIRINPSATVSCRAPRTASNPPVPRSP